MTGGTKGVSSRPWRGAGPQTPGVSGRRVLSLGGLGVALGPIFGLPRPRTADAAESLRLYVDAQTSTSRTNQEVSARLLVSLRDEETDRVIVWSDLKPYAQPGVSKHALHVHIYDNEDPDLPGIEVGHLHPEEFADPSRAQDGRYFVDFDFPHGGLYTVEVGYLLKEGKAPATASQTIRVGT